MKRFLFTWMLALCAGAVMHAQSMSDGHTLTALWKQYQDAQKADRPQLEADLLAQIKEEAIQKHLPVDFYDAATAYVTTVQRRDWKQRDQLRENLAAEVKAFNEPMVTFHWMNNWNRASTDALWAFVQANPEGFQGHNPAFYRDVSNYLGGRLTPYISSDKEYVLWRLLKDRYYIQVEDDAMYQMLQPLVKGRYPNEAALKYYVINRNYRSETDREKKRRALRALADEYNGKAVSVYPKADLLSMKKIDLDAVKASGKEYEALCEDARALEKERKAYKGTEGDIAAGCTVAENLVNNLTDKDITVWFQEKNALIVFRNLKEAKVTLTQDGKTLKTWKAVNPVGSFYVRDSLLLPLPKLADGNYRVEAVSGKLSDSDAYSQYTLSIATRTDSRGQCVYVTDYKTGVPLSRVTLRLMKDNKELASSSMRLDGFTPLPKALVRQIEKSDAYLELEAVSGDRKSYRLGVGNGTSGYSYSYNGIRCLIYKDQGAYRPGDIVRFKAVVYQGNPALSLEVCKDKAVTVRLRDSEGNDLESQNLTTNEFGAVSGQFELPRGLRNGRFQLVVNNLGSTSFTVDEFVLPTFDLSWDKAKDLYLVGDDVPVSGALESYSGHPLSGARIAARVLFYDQVVKEEDVPVDENNRFHFTFPARSKGYYNVEVNVTDATGETLLFSRGVYIGEELTVSASVTGSATTADLVLKNDSEKIYWPQNKPRFTLLSTDLDMTLDACDGQGNTVPIPVKYKILKADDSVITSGETPSGGQVQLKLPGAGFYRVLTEVSARRKDGSELKNEKEMLLFCIPPESNSLMPQAARVFIPGPLTVAAGGSIQARVGTSEGTAYAMVLLYGKDGEVLETKKLMVADGTLENLSFPYKAAYPDAVRLQVFYFLDGRSVCHDKQYRREKDRYTMPLQFTRFQDKAYPGAEYSFTLKTAPDTEVLVAAWDKSLDAIEANYWSRTSTRDYSVDRLYVSEACGSVGKPRGYDGPVIAYGVNVKGATARNADRMVMAEAAPMLAKESTVSQEDELISDEAADLSDVKIRSDFASALTFQPHLRPSADGTLTFSFRTSDKLSTYYVRALAHDAQMRSAVVEQEMVVWLPVKVSLLEPRYLYRGDVYEAAVTVTSAVDEPVSGVMALQAGSTSQQIPITVNPRETVTHRFRMTAESNYPLELIASFKAADFSDAVKATVPVYPASQALVEAHSAVLHDGEDRDALLSTLRSRFVNVPGSGASLKEVSILDMVHEAIPSHVDPSGKDVLSLSEAWYIRLMASRLGMCLTEASPSNEELLDKILACHNDDGGFGWFEGMKSSPAITAVLLERFAKLRDRGFEVPDVVSAVEYLDVSQFDDDFPYWRGGISDAQYLHIRSLYPAVPFTVKPVSATEKKRWTAFQKWAKDYLVPSKKDGRGLKGQILAKSRRLLTLKGLMERDGGVELAQAWGVKFGTKARLQSSMKADILSLMEYAVEHRDGGWYYPNAVMPWRGLMESEAYAHALLCDLMSSVEEVSLPTNKKKADVVTSSKIADGVRLWLMLQKETQKWDTEPAYIDAITSILDGSQAVLNTRVLALSATYQAPFQKVKAAGNGFKIERKFYKDGVEIKPGDPVSVGDRIVANYVIWNAENRSFVKLTAGREATLQPVNQLSGHLGYSFYRPMGRSSWSFVPQGYRNVKPSCTEFYFDSYPEENTELSEEFYVQQAGQFQAPVLVIESLYAPHYRANSAYRPALEVSALPK